jgi:hypothetical protein
VTTLLLLLLLFLNGSGMPEHLAKEPTKLMGSLAKTQQVALLSVRHSAFITRVGSMRRQAPATIFVPIYSASL